ncbi:MAG: hypothetical protein GX268_02655 [Methanomicrobiales archaeon]|nr:hypothetical protein [Methanomicrobiales archaeon]
MSQIDKIITLSIRADTLDRLNHLANERHMSIEDIVLELLSPGLKMEMDGITRELREIIRRQDEEITWLRDQIARLTTLTPTTHVIKHEYPAFMQESRDVCSPSSIEQSSLSSPEKEPESEGITPASNVSVDDVQFSPSDNGVESEDIMNSSFSGSLRTVDRTLRDSIGGVSEEVMHTIAEAAAIAGENESVLLEYIFDGFLPAVRDGTDCRIRGIDLRRYMMSR